MNSLIDYELCEVECTAKVLLSMNAVAKATARYRLSALKQVLTRLNEYRIQGFLTELLVSILIQKTEQILVITTKKEADEVGAPPKPFYNGGKFIAGPYDTREEELILWCNVSLHGPLAKVAFERYVELFRECFGNEPV